MLDFFDLKIVKRAQVDYLSVEYFKSSWNLEHLEHVF